VLIVGRLPRATNDGLVYHAMNRGNNRAEAFASDGDHGAFLRSLRVVHDPLRTGRPMGFAALVKGVATR
jgi:hypothetical protein